LSHGSSDAVFFIEQGVPVILTRPLGGGEHSPQEWVDAASLKKFYLLLRSFVEQTK